MCPYQGESDVQWWRIFEAVAADWLLGLAGDEALIGCAIAARTAGCESSSLTAISRLREPDRDAILNGIFGAFEERGLQFPLRVDAIKLSADFAAMQVVSGGITPADATGKLRRLADRDEDGEFPVLQRFRDLDIELDLSDEPDFEFDPERWRADVLGLAQEVLERGGVDDTYYD